MECIICSFVLIQNEPKNQGFTNITKILTSSSKTNELANAQTPFVFTSLSVEFSRNNCVCHYNYTSSFILTKWLIGLKWGKTALSQRWAECANSGTVCGHRPSDSEPPCEWSNGCCKEKHEERMCFAAMCGVERQVFVFFSNKNLERNGTIHKGTDLIARVKRRQHNQSTRSP